MRGWCSLCRVIILGVYQMLLVILILMLLCTCFGRMVYRFLLRRGAIRSTRWAYVPLLSTTARGREKQVFTVYTNPYGEELDESEADAEAEAETEAKTKEEEEEEKEQPEEKSWSESDLRTNEAPATSFLSFFRRKHQSSNSSRSTQTNPLKTMHSWMGSKRVSPMPHQDLGEGVELSSVELQGSGGGEQGSHHSLNSVEVRRVGEEEGLVEEVMVPADVALTPVTAQRGDANNDLNATGNVEPAEMVRMHSSAS